MKAKNKRFQTIMEYCIFMATIIGALLAMKLYAQRGLQGFLKKTADQMSEHKETAAFYTKEQIPWLDDANTTDMQGVNNVKNRQKEKIENNKITTGAVSYSENKFFGSSINAVSVTNPIYKNNEYTAELESNLNNCTLPATYEQMFASSYNTIIGQTEGSGSNMYLCFDKSYDRQCQYVTNCSVTNNNNGTYKACGNGTCNTVGKATNQQYSITSGVVPSCSTSVPAGFKIGTVGNRSLGSNGIFVSGGNTERVVNAQCFAQCRVKAHVCYCSANPATRDNPVQDTVRSTGQCSSQFIMNFSQVMVSGPAVNWQECVYPGGVCQMQADQCMLGCL